MKILLDECVDPRVAKLFAAHHEVSTVGEQSWCGLKNGELVRAANPTFDCLFTVDNNMRFQTNIANLNLSVAVAPVGIRSVEGFQPYVEQFEQRIQELLPGEYLILDK
ncbi:MAG TPA: DUF5615 family PIN-like protein [Fimbriimonas sp.]|nr:DUF5615 family PIN-like protein [Fimbriimonas sp.]